MLPRDELGSIDRRAAWLDQVRSGDPLVDYEKGGAGLNDASQGLRVQTWRLEYRGSDVIVSDEAGAETVLFTRPGIVQIALAFDQLMAPFVAFVDGGGLAYWWFNPGTSQMEFSAYLTAGSDYPRASMDDTRELSGGWSDVILAYMRGRDLYYRQQRDNYAIERLLQSDAGGSLRAVGMNRNLSFQFRLTP